MKWCAVMLLLLVGGAGWATNFVLVPENNPKPDYPTELARSGVMGEARVSFTVHADGSVDEVEVLKSDHPDFAEASLEAVSQWRFKPWTVDSEHPERHTAVAPMEFRLDLDLPLDANKEIKAWRCSDINAHTRNQMWHMDLMPFHFTRGYLSNVFFAKQLPDAERLALIARFNREIPRIVQRCGSFPGARYVKMLPEDVRELL